MAPCAQALISSLFRAVLAALGSEDEEVSGAVLPFLGAYVAKLKAGLKRSSSLAQVTLLPLSVTARAVPHAAACWSPTNTQHNMLFMPDGISVIFLCLLDSVAA